MAHTLTSLHTHLIFSTKHRRPLLLPTFKSRLFDYMGGIIRNMDGQSLLINGPDDHVHVLAGLPTTRTLSDFLRDLKGDSSRWVKETLNQPDFGWQTGYAAFSLSKSNLHAVRDYIHRQEEHHRKVSFQAEYMEFLRRHEIEFDERFVFD